MNEIHPTAVIAGDVLIGDGNYIGPFAVITGPTSIGDGNWIGTGVVIGAPPEIRSFEHPRAEGVASTPAGVAIGSRNVIREYAQVHQGHSATTTIGDDGFIMNQVYVAHDGRVGDRVTLASSVLLAGHVTVGDGANLGMGATVHQFRTVGAGAMVGMSSVVTHDIPPFALVYGSPARVRGANRVGLQRAGVTDSAVEACDNSYASGEPFDVERWSLPEAVARAFAPAPL